MRLSYLAVFGIALMTHCQSPTPEEQAEVQRPNILFCIADDASFPHMGAYGCSWVNTPGFDRVAQEGLLFTRAYTPNAKCAPSRSCILTGRNPWQLEEAVNHSPNFPAKFKTYAEALSERGYHVGYTAKGWAPGNPGEVDGKKRELAGTPYNEQTTTPPTAMMSKIDYTANFRDFLDARPEGEPFCFWYGATEPHRAYEYGSSLTKGNKQLSDIDAVPPFWPDNDSVRTDMLDYAFEIEYFDHHLQQMLALLEEQGELDNTLVVVTADNGMPFPRIKGQEYEYSNHLPLAIMWKEGIAQAGKTIEAMVNFVDFTPTFLEIAQVSPEESGMQAITGTSLTEFFRTEPTTTTTTTAADDRDHVLIGKERHDVGRPHDQGYPIRGIVKGEFLYLQNFEPDRWPTGNPETGYLNTDGSPTKSFILNQRRNGTSTKFWELCFGKRSGEELYQIGRDPACMSNLADSPEYQGIKDQLRAQMLSELEEQGDPRVLGNGAMLEAYEYSSEANQGFYERYMKGEDVKAGWVNESDFEKTPLDGEKK